MPSTTNQYIVQIDHLQAHNQGQLVQYLTHLLETTNQRTEPSPTNQQLSASHLLQLLHQLQSSNIQHAQQIPFQLNPEAFQQSQLVQNILHQRNNSNLRNNAPNLHLLQQIFQNTPSTYHSDLNQLGPTVSSNTSEVTRLLIQKLMQQSNSNHTQALHQLLLNATPSLSELSQPNPARLVANNSSEADLRMVLQLLHNTTPAAQSETLQTNPGRIAALLNTNSINSQLSRVENLQNSLARLPNPSVDNNITTFLLRLLQETNSLSSAPPPLLVSPRLEQESRGANLLESVLFAQLSEVIASTAHNTGVARASVASIPQTETQGDGISLYLHKDDDYLSGYQITVRKQLEFFVSKKEDVESNIQGRKKQITLGQVGIRCRHCLDRPLRQRGRGAVYYPTKLSGVYQAAQNMAATHLSVSCFGIPTGIRQNLLDLHSRRDTASGGKQYWAGACDEMGLYEDESGIRFRQTIEE